MANEFLMQALQSILLPSYSLTAFIDDAANDDEKKNQT